MYNDSALFSYLNDDILTVAGEEKDKVSLVRYLDAEPFHNLSQKTSDPAKKSAVAAEEKPVASGTTHTSYPPVLMPPQPEGYLKAGKYDFF